MFTNGAFICDMKRHEYLIPLSRFHRSALFLAQMCKQNGPVFKGYPTTSVEKATYALDFYERDLKQHFDIEESIVFPRISGISHDLDNLVSTAREDHDNLRSRFENLHQGTDLVSDLDQLGKLLERHIRMEERQLFQLLQDVAIDRLAYVDLSDQSPR